MAIYTPPSRLPTWATDGGADVTDPGTSKQATGWIEGEAPAADHTNWLANGVGAHLDLLQNTLAPLIAYSNINWTTTEPWSTTTPIRTKANYLSTFDRHYVVQKHNTDDITAWDSADGITWSSAKLIDAASAATTQFVTDGTNLFIGVDDQVYRSTTSLVTDLTSFDFPPGVPLEMVYDDTNSLFIICCDNGNIYSSPDADTWTSRVTTANSWRWMDHDPSTGTTVAQETTTDDFHFTTNGTTWTTRTGPSAYDNAIYSSAANSWVLRKASDGVTHIADTTSITAVSPALVSIDIECSAVIDAPEFCFILSGVTSTTTVKEGWYALKNKAQFNTNNSTLIYLGGCGNQFDVHSGATMINTSWFKCGNGIIYWLYDGVAGGDRLAYSQYGAPAP